MNADLQKIKFELLKIELDVINSRKNNIISTLWKIKQISITLWLAVLTIGLGGVLNKMGTPLLDVILVSGILPFIFMIIDSSELRWWYRFDYREEEIKQFINNEEYILPSNGTKLNFNNFLNDANFDFPLYDLTGILTFGNNRKFKKLGSRLKAILSSNSLLYYGLQIMISSSFLFWNYYKDFEALFWLLIPFFILILLVFSYLFGKFRTKKIKKQLR